MTLLQSSVELEIQQLKLRKLEALEAETDIVDRLPHLYMHKQYKWAHEFENDLTTKTQIVCASNQVGKSTQCIKKLIRIATEPECWPTMWPDLPEGMLPSQWWYLYPTNTVASIEFKEKWEPLLPKYGQDHPRYGFRVKQDKDGVESLHFNTGINIYFKHYSQNAQALQSGSAYVVACFVAGTMVQTPHGERPVESIKDGDLVLTRNGYERVKRTSSRMAEVMTVVLSNGKSLTGTPDHKIWTQNRGWVSLADLTPLDSLLENPECKYKRKQEAPGQVLLNWFYSMGRCISGSLTTQTDGEVTTSIGQVRSSLIQTLACMLQYGKNTIAQLCRMVASFITSTLTRSTIIQAICKCLQNLSTQESIKSKSGKIKRCGKGFAKAVAFSFLAEVVRTLKSFAVRLVTGVKKSPLYAKYVGYQSKQEVILNSDSVLRPVQIGAPENLKKQVYCLTVENTPEYFANGALVHNCDEEVPTSLIPELQMRVKATKGYMFFVFTATIGQPFWKDAVENRTIWPEARVWQVSMRDCKYYTDGTPSQWTDAAVDQVIRDCISPEEVQRRVHGKIIGANDVGRQFPTFARIMHMRPYLPIPKDYMLYAGVDYGSGTQPKGHPSAITVIAVNIARTRGRVVRFWRGDDMQTTCGDVIDMYEEITRGLTMQTAFYDFSARDLGTIATRRGLPFQQADKRRESGKSFINTLFKNGALHLDEMNDAAELDNILPTQLETWKLADELENLQEIVRKTSAKDDGIDSLRYAVHGIAWDWDSMRGTRPQGIGNSGKRKVEEEVSERQLKTRWDGIPPVEDRDSSIIEEFDFWEQQLDAYT